MTNRARDHQSCPPAAEAPAETLAEPGAASNRGRLRKRRGWRVTALLVGGLALTGCFEDPVAERLHLCIADDTLLVAFDVALDHPFVTADEDDDRDPNEQLILRLEAASRELLAGHGDWHERFDRLLTPSFEGSAWQKTAGQLTAFRRWAVTAEPDEALRSFLTDVPLDVLYTAAVGDTFPIAELQIHPNGGDRATQQERLRVAAALDSFAATVAAYYRAIDQLFGYLRRHPDQRAASFELLFEDDDEARARLDASAVKRVEAVRQAEESVVAIFDVEAGEAFTMQELSRRVFDPFPAEITLRAPGRIVELSGFVRRDDGLLGVPRTSLWDAFDKLSDRFVAPDPLAALMRSLATDSEPDLTPFLAGPLRSSTPLAAEVREALLLALEPPTELRLTWQPPNRDSHVEGEEASCQLPPEP